MCICGAETKYPEKPETHHKFCPVARFYGAIAKLRGSYFQGVR
jgi:hypothetical protein